jgi:hypothetical protein
MNGKALLALVGLGGALAYLLSRGDGGDTEGEGPSPVQSDEEGGPGVSTIIPVVELSESQQRAALPVAARPYAEAIFAAAAETGEDPLVLAAIGQHESNWGTSRWLHQAGPGGTGDFMVRSVTRAGGKPGVQQVGGLYPVGRVSWTNPQNLAPPFVVPADSLGWGRGLMQLDWVTGPAQQIDWANPFANVIAGARVLAGKRRYVASKTGLVGDELTWAAVGAYNAGEGRVSSAILNGQDPDTVTYGGKYIATIRRNYTNYINAGLVS